jgi:steroid 5-alpha reductase family enzyme
MDLVALLAASAFVVLGYVTAIWLLSLALRNASIIDIFWGLGFVVLTWVYFALADGWDTRSVLISVIVTVWGLRLSAYILYRNWGEGEDRRYQRMRRNAGDAFWWRSYITVFLLQGLLLWTISMPLLAAQNAAQPDSLRVWDFLGVGIWAVGFIFEAGGDWQLMRFKADPANKGKVMNRGFWRYTRHPNYFGDAVQWWGFFIIAAHTTDGWITVFSPVIMTFLLARVSGATLLERDLAKSKPGYEEYIRNTSGFVPWFPQGGKSAESV